MILKWTTETKQPEEMKRSEAALRPCTVEKKKAGCVQEIRGTVGSCQVVKCGLTLC